MLHLLQETQIELKPAIHQYQGDMANSETSVCR
jgi:hypothetical protein